VPGHHGQIQRLDALIRMQGAQAPRLFQREPAAPPAHFTRRPADFSAEPRVQR